MKHIVGTLLVAAMFLSGTASTAATDSDRGSFGLGIMAGEPTGISGKLYMSRVNALDFGVAWSFSGSGSFHIHGDYLIHNYSLIDVETGELPIYFGIGGRIKFRENADDKIGIRIPVGIAYDFAEAPIDIFLEIVPIMDLAPDTDLSLNAALGARFYF